MKIPLPEPLLQLYREVGDGVALFWNDGEPIPPSPEQLRVAAEIRKLSGLPFHIATRYSGERSGGMRWPPIAKLVASHLHRSKRSVEYNDNYDFHGVKDRHLARQTALRMRQWFRFHDEGNGDQFCIDTAATPNAVVFDQHDWCDGGSGANGAIMASSLPEFIEQWSKICFQNPKSNWWPSVLGGSGVDWTCDEFDSALRLSDSAL
jgi:hypothetical protein